jgi:hypothetical protein
MLRIIRDEHQMVLIHDASRVFIRFGTWVMGYGRIINIYNMLEGSLDDDRIEDSLIFVGGFELGDMMENVATHIIGTESMNHVPLAAVEKERRVIIEHGIAEMGVVHTRHFHDGGFFWKGFGHH